MRRAGWNDASGPWAGAIRTLDGTSASSYAIAYNWDDNRYYAAWVLPGGSASATIDPALAAP